MATLTNSAADATSFYLANGSTAMSAAEIETRIARSARPRLERPPRQIRRRVESLPRDIWRMMKSYVAQNTLASGPGGTLTVPGASTLTGTVGCGGALSVAGASTLTGTVGCGGALSVAGATTLTGAATLSGGASVAGSNSVQFAKTTGAPGTAGGTKLRLYPTNVAVGTPDFSLGIDASTMWLNVASNSHYEFNVNGITVLTIASNGLAYAPGFVNARGAEVQPIPMTVTMTGSTAGSNSFIATGYTFFAWSTTTVSITGYGRIYTGTGYDGTGCRPYIRTAGVTTVATSDAAKLPRAYNDDPSYASNFTTMATFSTIVNATYIIGLEFDSTTSDDNFTCTCTGAVIYHGPA